MLPERPTAEQVRAYRDEHECGLHEAVNAISKEWRRDCVKKIKLNAGELYTIEQCRDVIADMLDLIEVLVERGQ